MGVRTCKRLWSGTLLAALLGARASAVNLQQHERGVLPHVAIAAEAAPESPFVERSGVSELASESSMSQSATDSTVGTSSCTCSEVKVHLQWSLSSFLGGLFIGLILAIIFVAAFLPKEQSFFARPTSETAKTEARKEPGDLDGGDIPEVSPTACSSSGGDGFVGGTSPSGAADSPTDRKQKSSIWKAPESARSEEETFENQTLHLFWPRVGCLVLMLLIQSISSIVLSGFEELIEGHPSLVYFLTMLVGLGGNAGGQSVVLSVRRIALGEPVHVSEQFLVGLKLSLIICPLAFVRAIVQHTTVGMSLVIGASAFVITIMATSCGTALPKIMHMLWMDPAHSASVIQVLMDIGGITIVCLLGVLFVHTTGVGPDQRFLIASA